MKRSLFPLLGVLLASACATLALPRANNRSVPNLATHLTAWELPSGLRVMVDRDANSPVVSITTLVRGGGVSDPVGKEGLSHVVGHLSLRSIGSTGLPYYLALEQAGVSEHDLRSTFDFTAFEAQSTASTLDRWLRLELERVQDPLRGIDEQTFELTKEIVRNELRERREMVEGADFEWIQQAVFAEGHPYRRPVLGSHQSLAALTLADARTYAQNLYSPANITVHLSGGIDESMLAALNLKPVSAEALAASAAEPHEVPTGTPHSALPAQVMSEHSAGVATPRLYLVWSLPPGYTDNDEMLRNASVLASQTLQTAWHYDEDVMALDARTVLGAQASLLVVTVDLFHGTHPAKTMEHVLNYVMNLAHPFAMESLTTREFQYTKSNYSRALNAVYQLENPARRARTEATDWAFAHRLDTINRQLSMAFNIRPRSSDALFSTWVTRERARGVLVWPINEFVQTPANQPTIEPTVTAPRLVAQPNIDTDALHLLAPTITTSERTLDNGLRVVVVPRQGWPVASVSLAFPGGAATGPLGAARLTEEYAYPRLVTYGRPGDYGLRTSRDFEQDLQVLTAEGKRENLDNILAQFSTTLTSQHLDGQLQTTLGRYQFPFERLRDDLPLRKAEREVMHALLPNSPLGVTAVTSDLEQVSIREADSWANDAATPHGAVLTIVGDVLPDQVFTSVNTWLGGWQGRPAPSFGESPKPTPQVVTTVRPGASQSRIRLSCRVDAATPAQRAANAVLAQWLLQAQNEALRDQLGVTTGFDSEFNMLQGGNAWVDLSALVDSKRLDDAMHTFRGTLAKLEGDPTVIGLDRARWGAARTQTHVVADSPTLASHLASRLARGYSLEELIQPTQALSQVTAADVATAMKSCAQTAVTSLVGDRSMIQSAAATP